MIHAQILKVDQRRRIVTGRVTEEIPDASNEVMCYESSKPNFQAWSAQVHKDSGGKSFGNVRAMHSPVAAGKLNAIHFDDQAKAIDVEAKIVDDQEWRKVLDGVYTGFSIGGKYAKRWNDVVDGKPVTKFTAAPNEISLVDRPCCPSAKFFDVLKADGTLQKVAFQRTMETNYMLFEIRKTLEAGGFSKNGARALLEAVQADDGGAQLRKLLGDEVASDLRKAMRQHAEATVAKSVPMSDIALPGQENADCFKAIRASHALGASFRYGFS